MTNRCQVYEASGTFKRLGEWYLDARWENPQLIYYDGIVVASTVVAMLKRSMVLNSEFYGKNRCSL